MRAELLLLCLFATLWTVALQAPLCMGVWSGLPFPSPRDLLNPGSEPTSLMSPALAGGFFTTSATWEVSPVHFKFGGYKDHPQDSRTCGFGDSIRF